MKGPMREAAAHQTACAALQAFASQHPIEALRANAALANRMHGASS